MKNKKRLAALLLCACMLQMSASVYAEENTEESDSMEVQIINGFEEEENGDSKTATIDDLQVEADCEIPDYAIVTPTSFEYVDQLEHYMAGDTQTEYSWEPEIANNREFYKSGQDAEFALLRVDLTNLAMKDKNFLENCTVKVVFDDKYEYQGWSYQYDYNANPQHFERNLYAVIDPEDQFAVGSMYQGHYAFGCTLPNPVVESKAPLRMEITIDGNELIYNIRK